MRAALALHPCRAISRSTLIVFVPAVLDPLIDAATHIVQSKRICPEAADLDRLLRSCDIRAVLTVSHAGLELIAPPVLRLGTTARGIFPFSFRRKPIGLSRRLSEPCDILFGIGPAYVRHGCLVFSSRHEPACFCGSAFIPLSYGNWKFADRERLDCNLMNRLFRTFFIAAHCEAAAPERAHLRLAD